MFLGYISRPILDIGGPYPVHSLFLQKNYKIYIFDSIIGGNAVHVTLHIGIYLTIAKILLTLPATYELLLAALMLCCTLFFAKI